MHKTYQNNLAIWALRAQTARYGKKLQHPVSAHKQLKHPPQEEDWKVLELTLSAIKKRLCNAQFHTRRNLDSLTEQLVELLNNTKRLEELKNTPKDFHASEVRLRIYPVCFSAIHLFTHSKRSFFIFLFFSFKKSFRLSGIYTFTVEIPTFNFLFSATS